MIHQGNGEKLILIYWKCIADRWLLPNRNERIQYFMIFCYIWVWLVQKSIQNWSYNFQFGLTDCDRWLISQQLSTSHYEKWQNAANRIRSRSARCDFCIDLEMSCRKLVVVHWSEFHTTSVKNLGKTPQGELIYSGWISGALRTSDHPEVVTFSMRAYYMLRYSLKADLSEDITRK